MARPASPPRPCRDRTVSKATLPGRACTDKVDRRTRALRAWENAMVFLGIDVSKGRLDCAVLAAEGGRSPGRRSFRNDAEGAERAATWTAQVSGAAAADTHVILEATAAYRLAALGTRVSIVNPAQVRSFAKGIGVLGKTDRIDAQLLARYGQLARPRAWFPPARALLDLQGLIARLDDIEADLRREGSRLEQARTRGCPDVVEQFLLASLA